MTETLLLHDQLLIWLCLIQGMISVGVDATDLFDRYEEDYEDVPGGGFPHVEINKMHISQSIEVIEKLEMGLKMGQSHSG